MGTPFIKSWLKTGHPTERVFNDSKPAPEMFPEPDLSHIEDVGLLSPGGMQEAIETFVDDDAAPDDETWPSFDSGSTSSDDEDKEDHRASRACFTRELLNASIGAIDSYNALLSSRYLKNNQDITLYISTCSAETMERLHSAAINAKDAAQLRRSAVLLDIEYFLRRLDPLLAAYEKANSALSSVSDTANCIQKAVQQLEHSVNPSNKVSGQQVPTTTRPPTGSFMSKQSKIYSKIRAETEQRPMAHFTARLFVADGRFLTDHRLTQFLEVGS